MKNFTKGTNTTVFAWPIYYGIQLWKKEGWQSTVCSSEIANIILSSLARYAVGRCVWNVYFSCQYDDLFYCLFCSFVLYISTTTLIFIWITSQLFNKRMHSTKEIISLTDLCLYRFYLVILYNFLGRFYYRHCHKFWFLHA